VCCVLNCHKRRALKQENLLDKAWLLKKQSSTITCTQCLSYIVTKLSRHFVILHQHHFVLNTDSKSFFEHLKYITLCCPYCRTLSTFTEIVLVMRPIIRQSLISLQWVDHILIFWCKFWRSSLSTAKRALFSSPGHEVLMVSYCGQWLSVVGRRASSVKIWFLHSRDHIRDMIFMKLSQNVCFDNI